MPDLTPEERAGLVELRRIGQCEASEGRLRAARGRRHGLQDFADEKERIAARLTAALAVLDEILGGGNG